MVKNKCKDLDPQCSFPPAGVRKLFNRIHMRSLLQDNDREPVDITSFGHRSRRFDDERFNLTSSPWKAIAYWTTTSRILENKVFVGVGITACRNETLFCFE
jgi:hypothetical protein